MTPQAGPQPPLPAGPDVGPGLRAVFPAPYDAPSVVPSRPPAPVRRPLVVTMVDAGLMSVCGLWTLLPVVTGGTGGRRARDGLSEGGEGGPPGLP